MANLFIMYETNFWIVLQWGGGGLLLLPHCNWCPQRSEQQEWFSKLVVSFTQTMIYWFYSMCFSCMLHILYYYYTLTTQLVQSHVFVQHWNGSNGHLKLGHGRLWHLLLISFNIQFRQARFVSSVLGVAAVTWIQKNCLLTRPCCRTPFLHSCNI